jgi:hypothetical protein
VLDGIAFKRILIKLIHFKAIYFWTLRRTFTPTYICKANLFQIYAYDPDILRYIDREMRERTISLWISEKETFQYQWMQPGTSYNFIYLISLQNE